MLAYRKNQTKSDPVREILAQIEERQSKTGLSLFVKEPANVPEERLPSVHGEGKVSGSVKSTSPRKNTSMFPSVTAAREKAQARFHAQEVETEFKSSTQTRKLHRYPNKRSVTRRLNKTYPPALPPYNRTAVDDILAPGGGDAMSGLGINMNPFGYSRRNLAYSQTHSNYVVEWPETWPFKIMSLDKERKKATRTKLNPEPLTKTDKQDLIGDKKCEIMAQNMPSRRKANKVAKTKAERNILTQPQDLVFDPRRESTIVNHSGYPPKQRTVPASNNQYSPPIPPYPSSEQMEKLIPTRLVSMETSPLGAGKAILPPIMNKGETDKVCLVTQELLPRDTCGITEEDEALQNEERKCVNVESSDAHGIASVEGTDALSQEKEEGNMDTFVAGSKDLDAEGVTRRGIVNNEFHTVAPNHLTTPLHNESFSTPNDDKPFIPDNRAAKISRKESPVAPRHPTTPLHNESGFTSTNNDSFTPDGCEATTGKADSQVGLGHTTMPIQSGTASNDDNSFTFDNSKAVIKRVASQVAKEDILTDSQNI